MKKRTLAHENDWYYNNYIMRLLIVEDENDLRNIVKKRLVKEHYSVDACGDGLEAMDYIVARKVLKKFESMNVTFVRDEITGLISYIEKIFGKVGMEDSKAYLRRIQNFY